MRICFVNRGLPGRGYTAVVCSSDHYFIDKHGIYRFVAEKRSEAHDACQRKCLEAMESGRPVVIIDNTCCTAAECKPYLIFARKFDYEVIFLLT